MDRRGRLGWLAVSLVVPAMVACTTSTRSTGSLGPTTDPARTSGPPIGAAGSSTPESDGEALAEATGAIDSAYVDQVLLRLDAAVGDLVRTVLVTGLTPLVIERLEALYLGEYLQLKVDAFQEDARNGFSSYRGSPGNKVTRVTQLISNSSSCIFAEVERDIGAVVVDPDPRLSRQWIGLVPLDPDRDRLSTNSTGWIYVVDGFRPDLSEPRNPCE